MQLKKDHLKLLIKGTVGLLLVYYVLHSRMVDFEALHTILLNPVNLLVAFAFFAFSAACGTARWYMLAKPQGLTLSYRKLFSLTMIGQFFNTFMPGAVGGDLIKAWYVAGQAPDKRTKAVFTVLVDRVLGLTIIVFYSAFTLLFYTDWLEGNLQLQMVAYAIWGFSLVSIVFSMLFFSQFIWKFPFFIKFLELLHKYQRVGKIIDSALLYRHHIKTIAWGAFLSALSVFGLNLFFHFQGEQIGIPMDLPHYFFVVPLALTVSAVPLLPGGIGTGQVAFFTLFKWVGMANPEQGGALCTVYQIYTILFNCLGAYFYLRFKRQPNSKHVVDISHTPSVTPVL